MSAILFLKNAFSFLKCNICVVPIEIVMVLIKRLFGQTACCNGSQYFYGQR